MNIQHIITKMLSDATKWGKRHFHLSTAVLLCLILGACRGAAGKTLIIQLTTTATSSSSLPQPASDTNLHLGTATPIPGAYPPPSSLASPIPEHTGVIKKATPYLISTPTPTPVVHWNADAIEVSWDGFGYISVSQPGWLSNTIARLAIYPTNSIFGYVTIDISAGKEAKGESASINSGWKTYSPQKTFVISCRSGMKMYRLAEYQLVSETPLSPGEDCSTYLDWALGESAVAFMASDHSIYTWKSDGTAPRKIVDYAASANIAWSPDSQKLAVEISENDSHIGTVNIIDRGGKLLNEVQIQSNGEGVVLGWLTNDVLMASYSQDTYRYYAIQTGQFLFSWTNRPADHLPHQHPKVSPDNRWVFIDQESDKPASTPESLFYFSREEYSLLDIQTGKSNVLTDNWGTYLGYAGWNADSTTLYVLSRPAGEEATAVPNVPYGLLGYDIQTHEYLLLFKDAVQVAWNNDKSWAFIVFSTPGKEGQLGLDGGLWKVGTTTLISQWHISDQMDYQDPALDSLSISFVPASIAWSHNNNYVAVSDKLGQIKLISTDGVERVLTEEMPDSNVELRWSPDDQHLLVLSDDRAWIVDMPNP